MARSHGFTRSILFQKSMICDEDPRGAPLLPRELPRSSKLLSFTSASKYALELHLFLIFMTVRLGGLYCRSRTDVSYVELATSRRSRSRVEVEAVFRSAKTDECDERSILDVEFSHTCVYGLKPRPFGWFGSVRTRGDRRRRGVFHVGLDLPRTAKSNGF
jgi:hypothetical protein